MEKIDFGPIKQQLEESNAKVDDCMDNIEKLVNTASDAAIAECLKIKKEILRYELYRHAQTCNIIADSLKED